jgi:hypothetical protein
MLHQERSGSTVRNDVPRERSSSTARCELRFEEFEARIRALEGWRAEKAGEERRLSTVSAGAGGVVAVIVRVLGGG